MPNVSIAALGTQQVCRVPDRMHSANTQALGIPTVSGSAPASGVGVVGMNGAQEGQVTRDPTSGHRGAPRNAKYHD